MTATQTRKRSPGIRAGLAAIASFVLVLAGCSSAEGGAGLTFAPSSAAQPAAVASAETSAAPSVEATPEPSADLGFVPGTKEAPRLIQINSNDKLLFAPNFLVVALGETVKFEITNTGKAEHEFMIGPQKAAFADEADTEVAGIKAGTTKSVEYTFKGPGPFAFACHAPGHYEHGMLGYIQVVGPDVPAVGTAKVPRVQPITMADALTFDPSNVPIAAGETVSFVVMNGGTVTHEFAIGPKGPVEADKIDGKIVKELDEIEGAHVQEVTYTFPATGAFAFACHAPGHFEAGMKGTLTLP